MALSFAQLITPVSKEQALEACFIWLRSLGVSQPESWQAGSIRRTTIEVGCEIFSSVTIAITKMAEGGHIATAQGDWLHHKAESDFDETPNPAIATQGVALLTAADDAPGPFVLAIGDAVIEHSETGQRFRNIEAGTLEAGGTLLLTFEAEIAGAAGNVPNETIDRVISELSGVTVTNPSSGMTSFTWITTVGSNKETDEEVRERCRTKWATLSYGAPGEAYLHWARSANAAVKRVSVDDQNPRGAGTIDVFIAGDLGPLPMLVETVKDYLLGADGVGRAPLEARAYLEVYSAQEVAITESGTVYLNGAYKDNQAKKDEIEAALTAFYSAIKIGGTKLSETGSGYVLVSAMQRAVTKITGVINFTPSNNADVELAPNEVPVPTLDLNYRYL